MSVKAFTVVSVEVGRRLLFEILSALVSVKLQAALLALLSNAIQRGEDNQNLLAS